MPDDDYKEEILKSLQYHKRLNDDYKEEILKSLQSHKRLIPSRDFNEYEYSLYLQYASSVELEKDIVTEKTYLKIVYEDNWEEDEEIVDDKIRMRYL